MREDASKPLESSEQSLDLIASLVDSTIVLPGIDSAALRRNNGNEIELERQLSSFIALIRAIHDQVDGPPCLAQLVQQMREKVSRAPSARDAATAYCQGTPLRNEIEARDASLLQLATDRATEAIASRHGEGPVAAKFKRM